MSKITVKHYLNKKVKSKFIDNENNYPIYVMVLFNRKKTEFKSNIGFAYDLELEIIKKLIAKERKLIIDLIIFYVSNNIDNDFIISDLKEVYRTTSKNIVETINDMLSGMFLQQISNYVYLDNKTLPKEWNFAKLSKEKKRLFYLHKIIDFRQNAFLLEDGLKNLKLFKYIENIFTAQFREQYYSYSNFLNSKIYKKYNPKTLSEFNTIVENDYFNYVSQNKNYETAKLETNNINNLIITCLKSIIETNIFIKQQPNNLPF